MLKFEVNNFTYKVKLVNDNTILISAVHTEKFYKWKLITDPSLPTSVGIDANSLYNLFSDYAQGPTSMFVSFDYPNKLPQSQTPGIPIDDLEIKLKLRINSWNGSHEDIKRLQLSRQHTPKDIRRFKRLESKLDRILNSDNKFNYEYNGKDKCKY